ncbi:hypothetical protein C8R47DRAFT_1226546 [Mycena vitilis]|nr:hypothetical protein C8R47DRAFT_1226546 [Mycena vitilis]
MIRGILFNTVLYGLVVHKFLAYFKTKSNDALWLRFGFRLLPCITALRTAVRVVVGALFVVDTIHTAVEVYAVYGTIGQHGNPTTLNDLAWIIPFTVVATSVSATMSHIFLAYRVSRLTKNNPLVGILYSATALSLVFGCVAGAMFGLIDHIARLGFLVPFVALWLGTQTLSNLAITVPLIRLRGTGFGINDADIDRLIHGALQTGTFASLFALADLFAFVFWRNTNLYAMFAFPIGRIYTNTLLHTLNARTGLKGMDVDFIDCDTVANTGVARQTRTRISIDADVEQGTVTLGRDTIEFRCAGLSDDGSNDTPNLGTFTFEMGEARTTDITEVDRYC